MFQFQAFLNAPASQIVKIDFRLAEKCPLLFSLVGIMDDFAYFSLFWPILVPYSPPMPSRVVLVCSGVVPVCFQVFPSVLEA